MKPGSTATAGRKLVSLVLLLVMSITSLAQLAQPRAAQAQETNLALGGTATASSQENATYSPDKAIDGSTDTRWATVHNQDPSWILVDLGAGASISRVEIVWEWASAADYIVEVSADNATWSTVATYESTPAPGERTDDHPNLNTSGRYVRVTGSERSSIYGYSIRELRIFGVLDVQTVSLDSATASVDEAEQIQLPVRLNKSAASTVTVDYAAVEGTALEGRDYTAISGTLTFDPGVTVLTVTLQTLPDEIDEPIEDLTVTLSNASSGVQIMPRASTTVRILDDDVAEYDGATMAIDTFEPGQQPPNDNLYGLFTFGDQAADYPVLTYTEALRPSQVVTPNYVMDVTYTRVGGWGGFTRNMPASQDWSDFQGISFWFKGSATGHNMQFEIKDGGSDGEHSQLWEVRFLDTSSDWRFLRFPFSDFVKRDWQPGGTPQEDTPVLNLVEMWGYAMNLPMGNGHFQLDHVQVYEAAITIEDFEGPVDFGDAETDQEGWFSFGQTEQDKPVLTVEALERAGTSGNHVLNAAVNIAGAYGGVVHNISFNTQPQDWSAFKGIRFWWYGTKPASDTAPGGPTIWFEIKDGGNDAEHAELWNTSFVDDVVGWRLIEIPFTQFVRRGDWQPGGAPNDGELNLTEMWGYAITPPAGMTGKSFKLDHIQVYGAPGAAIKTRVGTVEPVYLADEGDTVTVEVEVTTTAGDPLESDVVVSYSTTALSPTTTADFTPATGTLTFTAGMSSSHVLSFTVAIANDAENEVAELIELTLESADPSVSFAKDTGVIVINAHGLPYLNPSLPVEQRVADLLARMTLAEKVGQMTQAERGALDAQDDIATWLLGSLLSGGGSVPASNTPEAWAAMIDGYQLRAMQTRLQIPLIYGVDAVHGHNNVKGATIFPHNIGLGATRNPTLVQQVGALTANEVRATGIPWDFAPCLCVTRDERWGRSYESFGEDPALVSKMATIVTGMQGTTLNSSSVLATAKHWVGDGGTTYGTSTTGSYTIDQGITQVTMDELYRIHIAPYREAIKRGVGSIMPSYSSVDIIGDAEGPIKMHASKWLLTDVLKGELGFKGFIISDWAAIDQIPGDYRSDVTASISAGLDMIMVPYEYQQFETLLLEEVAAGRVTTQRIDDAVTRILTQKFKLGLFEHRWSTPGAHAVVGSAAHRNVARVAVARSQVLLKNSNRLLPLPRTGKKYYVAGSNANDIGNQSGGWTISWQGSSGNITPGTTILQGIEQLVGTSAISYSKEATLPTAGFDVGIVVVGETPYAEGMGDVVLANGRTDLSLSNADRDAIDTVCDAMDCVVVVVSGRPMLIEDKLAKIDALVAAWLPGTEGDGVAQPLFGVTPYMGRLPVSWPRSMAQLPINVGDAQYDPLYPFGWGLRTGKDRTRLQRARNALTVYRGNLRVKNAIAALDVALQARFWRADGSARNSLELLGLLRTAARELQQFTTPVVVGHTDTIVSVARDLAQRSIAAAPASPARVAAVMRSANAEHQLLLGKAERAVILLTQAAQVK